MTKTIAPKSDQLNYDDFLSGTRDITITGVKSSGNVTDQQPVSVHFEGDNGKPYKPCKSMRRVMVRVWGNDALGYVGKTMTLFGDPNVIFGGNKVGGIRISHMSHIDNEINVVLTASKAKRIPYKVKPLKVVVDNNCTVEDLARSTAELGMDELRTYYENLPGTEKSVVAKILPELKDIAAKADIKEPDFDDAAPDFEDGTGEVIQGNFKLDFLKELNAAENVEAIDALKAKHRKDLYNLKSLHADDYQDVETAIAEKEAEILG